jgi:hypothetical protein
MSKLDHLEQFTDAELHDELARRLKTQPESEAPQLDGLDHLPSGAWSGRSEEAHHSHEDPAEAGYEDLTEIAKLARARAREVLSIPIDPDADNAAATVRNINVAVSTILTLITKLKPRPTRSIDKLIERINAVDSEIRAHRRPQLMQEILNTSDSELNELLAKRREFLDGHGCKLRGERHGSTPTTD